MAQVPGRALGRSGGAHPWGGRRAGERCAQETPDETRSAWIDLDGAIGVSVKSTWSSGAVATIGFVQDHAVGRIEREQCRYDGPVVGRVWRGDAVESKRRECLELLPSFWLSVQLLMLLRVFRESSSPSLVDPLASLQIVRLST